MPGLVMGDGGGQQVDGPHGRRHSASRDADTAGRSGNVVCFRIRRRYKLFLMLELTKDKMNEL